MIVVVREERVDTPSRVTNPCAVCNRKRHKTVLAPCGHKFMCRPCTQALLDEPDPRCPICKYGPLQPLSLP